MVAAVSLTPPAEPTADESPPCAAPPGKNPGPSARALSLAESDLEWWHNCESSELGSHAASLEPGTIAWDQERLWHKLGRIIDPTTTRAVKRYYRVLRVWQRLSPRARTVAAALYTPRPWPLHLRAIFPCDRSDPGVITLVGAALLTPALAAAYAKAHGGYPAEAESALLSWLAESTRPRVDGGRIVNARLPAFAGEARREALALRAEVLHEYAERRHALAKAAAADEEAKLERLRRGAGP